MLKFFFIRRHRQRVNTYIWLNLLRPKSTDSTVRYSISSKPSNEEGKTPSFVGERNSGGSTLRKQGAPFGQKDSGTKPVEETTILYSDRDSGFEELPKKEKSSFGGVLGSLARDEEVKYSARGGLNDFYDSALVSELMRSYLQEKTPMKSLNSISNLTFTQKLRQYIRNKDLIEADVYKAALMDRRLFSKIICNNQYKPSKDTALALILALQLDLTEAKDMLERAGYTLSHSIKRDIIIEYFIKERIYNINNINAFLYYMDEKIIGRSV